MQLKIKKAQNKKMDITMSHGSGGQMTAKLINDIFFKHFQNDILLKAEDSAVLDMNGKIAFTTDSFVVEPLEFNGGDIGKLAVCGTVNDLISVGARPLYLTCGFIIGEGFSIEQLERIVISMSETAKEAGVKIVAGDTKVIETKGLFINTSGIGDVISSVSISNSKKGSKIIVTGNLGEHQASIMSARMGIENNIKSDVAPLIGLANIFEKLQNSPKNIDNSEISKTAIQTMRDITRGGLVTVLHELCEKSNCGVLIYEKKIPVCNEVKGFCDILGLEPIYMANEGKMLIVVEEKYADKVLEFVKNCLYCENATIVGEITDGSDVILKTLIGGERILSPLYSEGLPRIC
ncbi:hydrogenase expression/formation protein HypE [Clostridia bacterium]|nr:hydrogenase expression/formation protein HypE [Clostridia bacterium]